MRVFVTGVTGFVGSCRSGSDSFRISLRRAMKPPGLLARKRRDICTPRCDQQKASGAEQSGGNVSEREISTWFKIRNREYSQMVGCEQLFGT